jgi:hypothetical protein
MVGMLSTQLAAVQSVYLLQHQSTRPVSKWLSGLITQLLQVTHGQWIYRCVLVHDRSTGKLISAHKEDMLKEIVHQLALGDEGLVEEDKFLLECNFDELVTTNGEQQEYWILAIQAAREVCRLRATARGTLNAAGAVAPRHDNHLSTAGAVALWHRAIPCAAGAVASRQGTQNIAAGAVVPWQGTHHGAAGAEARRHGDSLPRRGRGSTTAREMAAGAVAPWQGLDHNATGTDAPRGGGNGVAAGAVVRRDGDTLPRRGRGRTTAWDTSQRRRRGTTAG